ncbi:hypothetical protein MYCTH_2311696 [Thermothelomyces thermophilus ATCC 42464]|uniref:RING-type domain-containing protein n=1 Tax=Thermothelomyces thermophilus (strain ATCC 42464 / BCRC 31852 / DSM 1799) TaxID=573729 RepID=G2QPI1_THET4|nr:uncharacterized protein MYCTH_2311696 [Thermothelomyces thermophilus ATCC 42464]AEO61494.1 hypothetical protein MYCTH_2311696 [Thermothelomyces thermophilus ATCC 42464]
MAPPPNTPDEGLTVTFRVSVDDELFRVSSPHPSSAMADTSQNGSCVIKLDYQALEYIDPVDETLLCPVCKTPFYSPITTPCGHTFCAGCINRALETQPTCPIDRQPINKTRDYRRLPLIVKDQLDRLKVKCPNKGCDHQCPRELLEAHYERRCEFSLVRCPDSNCTQLIARRDASPAKGCLHIDVVCEFCEKKTTFAELDGHHNFECDGAIVECPDCGRGIVRHTLVHHRTQECLEGHAQCKWHTAGCKVAGKRGVVQEHEQSGECSFEVLGRLIEKQAEDRKIINELSERLARFEAAQARRREPRVTQLSARGGLSPVAGSSRSAAASNAPDITLNNNVPVSLDPADDGATGGSPEDYMLAQFERLETQLELLRQQSIDMDARQSHLILQHATHFSEQLAEIGNKVGIVNMHMSWLMSLQRQQRAGSTAGSSSNAGLSQGTGNGSVRPASSDDSSVQYPGDNRRHSEGRGESLHRL